MYTAFGIFTNHGVCVVVYGDIGDVKGMYERTQKLFTEEMSALELRMEVDTGLRGQ